MTNIRDRFEDDDVFDENGILKDGKVARVRMNMRDGVDEPLSPAEMARRMHIADAERRRGLHVSDGVDAPFSLRRPGFRHLRSGIHQQQVGLDVARQQVADAHAEYLHDLENAWRTPPATNIGAHEHASPVEGGLCSTSGGYPGTWQFDDETGDMICVADPRTNGAVDGRTFAKLVKDRAAVMTPLYEAYAKELSEAWKQK